jgi:hypothetical protein
MRAYHWMLLVMSLALGFSPRWNSRLFATLRDVPIQRGTYESFVHHVTQHGRSNAV